MTMATPDTTHYSLYETSAERITHPPQIIGLLRRIMDGKNLLSVRVGESSLSHNSLLLDINTDKGYIMLDELNNERAHQQALERRKLRILCQCQGVELSFSCSIRVVHNKKGLTFYQAPLPEVIRYQQRRADFRVKVGLEQAVHLSLPVADQTRVDAELCDVSIGGVGARLENSDVELRRGLVIPECKITLTDHEPILTDLEIRFLQSDEQTQVTRIGGRFLGLGPEHRSDIRKMVTRLEREMLRRKTRQEGKG